MDKMSIWSALFVSFPEELLIVIITLASTGYLGVLDIRNKKNAIKLFSTAALMVITAVVLRSIINSMTIEFVIQTVLFYVEITVVYRYKIFASILGFILSYIVLFFCESVVLIGLMNLLNLSFEDIYKNDILRLLFSLPDRVFQIATVVVICKVRKINLRVVRSSIEIWAIAVLSFLILSNFVSSVEPVLLNRTKTSAGFIPELILSLIIVISYSLWLVYNMVSLKMTGSIRENMHDVELNHIKQLLEEGKTDYAVELIELTLRDRGYYDNIENNHNNGSKKIKGGVGYEV